MEKAGKRETKNAKNPAVFRALQYKLYQKMKGLSTGFL
jgi:hypothetical protein